MVGLLKLTKGHANNEFYYFFPSIFFKSYGLWFVLLVVQFRMLYGWAIFWSVFWWWITDHSTIQLFLAVLCYPAASLPNCILHDESHFICMHLSFLNNLCKVFIDASIVEGWGEYWFRGGRIGCFPYPFCMCFTPLSLRLWHLEKDLFVTVQLQMGHSLVSVFKNVWRSLQCFIWLCRDCPHPKLSDFCWMQSGEHLLFITEH